MLVNYITCTYIVFVVVFTLAGGLGTGCQRLVLLANNVITVYPITSDNCTPRYIEEAGGLPLGHSNGRNR